MRFETFLLWPVLAGLAACSPSQDWRDVALEVPGLKAQLPCKPDRTTREVPLGQRMVPLQVAGCESGSAMLTLTGGQDESVTSTMTVNFLRPAGANPVLAEARVIKRGKRMVYGDVTIRAAEREVKQAKARTHAEAAAEQVGGRHADAPHQGWR